MVRSRRLELPRVLPHSDLNAARLPIPPRPHCPWLGDGAFSEWLGGCEAEKTHICSKSSEFSARVQLTRRAALSDQDENGQGRRRDDGDEARPFVASEQ